MKWCEHIVFQNGSKKPFLLDVYYDRPPFDGHVGNSWGFCPVCGTPRPKEKTLAEKFKEYGIFRDSSAEALAQIAEDHFKNKN